MRAEKENTAQQWQQHFHISERQGKITSCHDILNAVNTIQYNTIFVQNVMCNLCEQKMPMGELPLIDNFANVI
jgi:hypothetical protein